jgi:hypothetical protein
MDGNTNGSPKTFDLLWLYRPALPERLIASASAKK